MCEVVSRMGIRMGMRGDPLSPQNSDDFLLIHAISSRDMHVENIVPLE